MNTALILEDVKVETFVKLEKEAARLKISTPLYIASILDKRVAPTRSITEKKAQAPRRKIS